jgi:antitoxin VapB
MTVAKVFWSGNSQAVRLPREFRLPDGVDEVLLHREGDRIVLEPPKRRRFSRRFWKALGSLPAFKRPRQIRQSRGAIFP